METTTVRASDGQCRWYLGTAVKSTTYGVVDRVNDLIRSNIPLIARVRLLYSFREHKTTVHTCEQGFIYIAHQTIPSYDSSQWDLESEHQGKLILSI